MIPQQTKKGSYATPFCRDDDISTLTDTSSLLAPLPSPGTSTYEDQLLALGPSNGPLILGRFNPPSRGLASRSLTARYNALTLVVRYQDFHLDPARFYPCSSLSRCVT